MPRLLSERRQTQRDASARIFWLALGALLLGLGTAKLSSGQFAHGPCWDGQCPVPPNPPAVWRSPSTSQRPPAGACRVVVRSPAGVSYGSGSLVAVRARLGYVVTCHHVIKGKISKLVVAFAGGTQYAARLLAIDAEHDLALLEIARPRQQAVRIATSGPASPLVAGGFGGDGNYRAITGPVVGYATPAGAQSPSLKIRGLVRAGDSGGPVLNTRGELVGVVWGVRKGLSYATFGPPLHRLLSRIPNPGQSPRPNQSPESGLIAVDPQLPERKPSELGTHKVCGQRLNALEKRLENYQPCPCTGRCVQPDQLSKFATQTDLADATAHASRRQSDVLKRIEQLSVSITSEAREVAIATTTEKLREARSTRSSLSTFQLIVGALGIGGPAGVALLAGGWMARRRVRNRLSRRGRGGPRPDTFPARDARQHTGGGP